MPLSYYPPAGEILVCHYDLDPVEPEMRKTRPVVVVGPRLRRRARLVTVVPLSTTEPIPVERFQYRIDLDPALPPPFDAPVAWAKCDMVSSVSLDRLDRFKIPRARYGGPRQWMVGRVSPEQLRAVRVATLCGLGFESLTKHM
ncbi:type II toxin-antitoxin system PemK/MazF family toxin [Sphingomonas sp.]|uniref:type II toxin-antitoxin system PemK/MazF family toxin n=1 Tax=Sphingomonas sp. TaxID=28214 RepID=UPI0035BBD1FC